MKNGTTNQTALQAHYGCDYENIFKEYTDLELIRECKYTTDFITQELEYPASRRDIKKMNDSVEDLLNLMDDMINYAEKINKKMLKLKSTNFMLRANLVKYK